MLKRQYIFFITGMLALYTSMTCFHKSGSENKVQAKTQTESAEYSFSNVKPEEIQKPAAEKNAVTGKGVLPDKFLSFLERLKSADDLFAEMPVPLPAYTRGIYLTNPVGMNAATLSAYIKSCKKYKLNTIVLDVQSKMPPRKHIAMIKAAGIFPVARVVVFDLGLKTRKPNEAHVQKILNFIDRSAAVGFQEVQLDYIRYADERAMQLLPLKEKYAVIGSLLERAAKKAEDNDIQLSADVFGRITLNKNDHIGQKVENFGKHVHTLYPMVYPSHYYGDKYRMNNPYATVKEGIANTKQRIPNRRVVAYIQGFNMKVKQTGLTLSEYVLKQMKAVDDAKGDGWVVWNARNDYKTTYAAHSRYFSATEKKAAGKAVTSQPGT